MRKTKRLPVLSSVVKYSTTKDYMQDIDTLDFHRTLPEFDTNEERKA